MIKGESDGGTDDGFLRVPSPRLRRVTNYPIGEFASLGFPERRWSASWAEHPLDVSLPTASVRWTVSRTFKRVDGRSFDRACCPGLARRVAE
jgi:hypothetical protein